MVVPRYIVYGVTEVHCLWWYRGTLPMVVPRYIVYGGTEVRCLWWYRGTLPRVLPWHIAYSSHCLAANIIISWIDYWFIIGRVRQQTDYHCDIKDHRIRRHNMDLCKYGLIYVNINMGRYMST